MISVNVICKNEEKNIEDCLKSVEWADEVIVVDGESNDKTFEIAKRYTKNVFVKEWAGFAKQRAFALEKSSNDWILVIDADERCSEELKKNILLVTGTNNSEYKGFRVPRKNFFLSKWIKHGGWYPGYQTRFFRKSNARVSDRLVHEGFEVDGELGIMTGDILHYTVQSISEFMSKVNKYSSLQAIEKSNRKTVKFRDILLRPMAAFFVQFFFRGGFKDGIHGLMVTNFDVITNMLTYMKIWEIQNKDRNK